MGAPEHRRISGSRQRLFWAGQNIGQRIGPLLELRFLVFYPKTIIRSGFWSLLEMLPGEQIPPVNSFLLLVPAPIAIQGCHLWRRPTAGDCEPPPSRSSSAAGSRKRRLRPGTLPPSISLRCTRVSRRRLPPAPPTRVCHSGSKHRPILEQTFLLV